MKLKTDDRGLIPAVIQDDDTGEVLMLGYMNQEALDRTMSGEDVWFYSRSRQEMWHKGATSGNYLKVRSVWLDCDNDTVLVKAHPIGPVCHTGNRSCFFQELPERRPAPES
jgi:phosphoribosyl-ATP pyrophosphohydrolase/phosphoribosyl-AMP cyclohydrolase